MRRTGVLLLVSLLVLFAVQVSVAEGAQVRPEHPRMLLNADDLPGIRERCKTTQKDTWEMVKKYADSRLDFKPTARPQPAVIATPGPGRASCATTPSITWTRSATD